MVRDAAGLRSTDVLLDLYCGTGAIGLSLARSCKQVIGVEVVCESIDAWRLYGVACVADVRCCMHGGCTVLHAWRLNRSARMLYIFACEGPLLQGHVMLHGKA